MVLRNGAGYARWVDRATLRRERLVDTTEATRDRLLQLPAAIHQHGPGGDHAHGALASTTWLDLDLARSQAAAVADALATARPQHAEAFRSAASQLDAELAALDHRLLAAGRALEGVPLLLSHPIYQYLAARTGLDTEVVAWEPGEDPGPAEWQRLERRLAQRPARAMLWEAEPRPQTRARLAKLGLEVSVFAPCANRPAQGDLLTVMADNAAALERLAPAP